MHPQAQRLFDAVQANDVDVFRTAIARHQAIFSHEDRHRNGVLHWVASTPDRTDMLRLILSAGGQLARALDSFNNSYRTPLMMAVVKGHLDHARLLLEAGADPNRQYEFMGKHMAALHEATSTAMVKLLVAYGAHLEARNTSMLTPLLVMAQQGRVEALDALLEAGANRAATVTRNPSRMSKLPEMIGYNALHLSVMEGFPGSTAMVVRLLDLGFSPLALTADGANALDLARALVDQGRAASNLGILEAWLLRQNLAQNVAPAVDPSPRSRL